MYLGHQEKNNQCLFRYTNFIRRTAMVAVIFLMLNISLNIPCLFV